MLNLIIDENIAFADQAFNHFGNVTLLPGRQITNASLKNTDILIVRSVTKVNKVLLKSTPVKFIGTTTTGTDHLDLDFLRKHNIAFSDAKGCNSFSVAEYVMAALFNLSVKLNFTLKDKTIGIIGVGNVGSKVAFFAEAIGMKVLLNDPPLQRSGDKRNFVELKEILSADVITLHTPLILDGPDKTLYLLNKDNLKIIKNNAIIINTARGAVTNNNELLDIIKIKKLNVVLDVWENEPEINLELLKQVQLGTPHIAGYSIEGKINGTKKIYNSLCNFLNEKPSFSFESIPLINTYKNIEYKNKIEIRLNNIISSIYSINNDDEKMRKMLIMGKEEAIKYFDLLRKEYPIRREFDNYIIKSDNLSEAVKKLLMRLRFNIIP